jgi:exopolysaccharide biosynthesis polyprenyl glycosylphosphotransferase
VADGLTTAASFVLAYFIWNSIRINTTWSVGQPIQLDWNDLWKIIGFSLIWVIILTSLKAYTYQRFTSLQREFSLVFRATVIGVFLIFAAFFLLRFKYVPRTYIFIFALTNFACMALEKAVLFRIAKVIRKRGKDRKKILVVGTGEKAIQFVHTVERNIGWGLDVIGYLTSKKNEVGTNLRERKILGTYSDVVEVLHKNIIDDVIICVPSKDFKAIEEVLISCEKEGVQVRLYSDFFGHLAKRISVDYLYDIPIVSFYTVPYNEWALYLKRFMDISVSFILLILLSPVFLFIAILIKLTSQGPILYQWKVVGLNKKPFNSWKFRTMIQNADEFKKRLEEVNEMSGPVFKMKDDPRITKVGKYLRKFSLDELPQLWSVLKGDMSLVGPRPPLQSEIKDFESWHRRKLSMKPGITCLWQVKGRNKINDFDDWAKLDLQYIDNWSIWLDIKILFQTVFSVLLGSGR